MQVIFFLVPLGLMVLIVAIWAFIWAVNSKQFEDMDHPAHQVVFDDKEERARSEQLRGEINHES
jgi:cbb3-type cytochrome oxidase maturation protein